MQKIQDRNMRKEKMEEKKLYTKLANLKLSIESRKIPIEIEGDVLESLEFASEKPILHNGELSWPVFFLYPEYSVSDYIQQFNENTT